MDCWGDNPPTEKALRYHLDTLKKLAAKYDSGSTNPSGVSSSGGGGGKGKSIKKEEGGGYVTPMSSPKAVSRSPSKSPHGRGNKRVKVEAAEEEEGGDSGTGSDVGVSTPRRTRRKVSLVKYVELGDGGSESGDMYEDDSEEDEWKPKAVDDGETEIVRAAGRSAVGHGGKSQVRGRGRVPGTTELEVGDSDEEEEEEEGRVRDDIRVLSNVLRENMSKGNFEVFA